MRWFLVYYTDRRRRFHSDKIIHIAGTLAGEILLGMAAAFIPGSRISRLNIIDGIKY